MGAHSNGHLLYCAWENRDSMLVSRDELIADLRQNARELEHFDVSVDESRWYLPPYEYYNEECVDLIENMGYKVINYTPGTATPADYTTPSMKNYQSSQKLIDRLYTFEKAVGLNGAVILVHPGVDESRIDRLYNRLDEIIQYLKRKGYKFKSFKELE